MAVERPRAPFSYAPPSQSAGSRAFSSSAAGTSQPEFNAALALRGARTPISGPDAARHLSAAWAQVTGEPPSQRTLSTLWAQWALETGRGKSMRGYNFGGLKGEAQGGGSAVLKTREGFGESEREIRSRFRTYSTPEQGALDYVRTLHQRYPEAARAASRGDVPGFVAGLEKRRYFTANPQDYLRAVQGLSAECTRTAGGDFSNLKDPGPWVDALLHTLSQAIARRRA